MLKPYALEVVVPVLDRLAIEEPDLYDRVWTRAEGLFNAGRSTGAALIAAIAEVLD